MLKIVFILPTYPEVMYSFLLSFAKQTGADIKIVCLKGLLQERKEIFSGGELSNYAQFSFYQEGTDLDRFIETIISENPDAIFAFGGFLGRVGRAIQIYRDHGGKQGVVITEKPSVAPAKHFNGIVRFLKKIKAKKVYSAAYKSNASAIQAVLVTGQKGVAQLKSYGVPEEKLYDFMYTHIEEPVSPNVVPVGEKVKFVYVGRFDFLNRGMDVLINTFNKLKQTNWTLDLVGGYGEDAEKVIAWANQKENVTYVGSWKSNEVISNLQNYDVCISPTRIDGWRIQVNQAIMAGIGTITTGEAISDELVKASDTGAVVDAFRHNALYEAVTRALENPDVVNAWKENTKGYRARISNETVANYFNEIIGFALSQNGTSKPECPWL